jgi:hypothetical protein
MQHVLSRGARGSDRAQEGLDRQPREEGSVLRRAEALAESTDWDNAAAEMKKLQADWKTVGPVRRNKSDVDLDALPRRRATSSSSATTTVTRSRCRSKLAEREAMVVELEGLIAPGRLTAPRRCRISPSACRHVRNNFNRAVPIPGAGMKALTDRGRPHSRGSSNSAGRVQGHGSRSGAGHPADGKARRARRVTARRSA